MLIDCDGTLVDTEVLWAIAERSTAERFGATLSPELESALVGQSVAACAAEIARHTTTATNEIDAIHHELVAAYGRLLGSSDVRPRPGAQRLLRELFERDIPTAVVSNSCERHVRAALVSAGLGDFVAYLQSPGPGIPAKPAPDLYLAACDRWSISPGEAIAIEDTQVGLDAARSAGLFTIGVPSVSGVALRADRTLASLSEVNLDQLGWTGIHT